MQPSQAQAAEPDATECPEFIRGSKLRVSNAKDGVVVTVTTTRPRNVPALRELLREVARLVEQQSQGQPDSDRVTSDDRLPELDMSTRDVGGGVEVIVRAEKSEDVSLVRKQAQELETAWQRSECVRGGATSAAR